MFKCVPPFVIIYLSIHLFNHPHATFRAQSAGIASLHDHTSNPQVLFVLQAFNGGLDTKWLDFGGGNGAATWLEYRLLPTQPAAAVTRYSMTSAEDEPNRDPCDFLLEGCLESPVTSGAFSWHVSSRLFLHMLVHSFPGSCTH